MRLIHFSKSPLGEIRPAQQHRAREMRLKPNGLWLSDESDIGWSRMAPAIDVELGRYQSLVTLAPAHNCLILSTPESILQLTLDFPNPRAGRGTQYINWNRIAQEFDGLIVTPYQAHLLWDRNCRWFRLWVAAVGCVWNPAAIQSIEPISTPDKSPNGE
jgi:hypothetical protein